MNIYQGEPLGAVLNVKGDDEQWLPSLEGYSFEAMLLDSLGKVERQWSTDNGDITIGTEVIEEETRGYASFSLDGTETADLSCGRHTLEVARVLGNGRAIGILSNVICILPSRIKKGVDDEVDN